jgi:hypothetical protein
MNARLFNTFVNQTQTKDHFYQLVDAAKAEALCQVAREVNAEESSCFKTSKAGDKELQKIVVQQNDHFQNDGLEVIDTYLRRQGFDSNFAARTTESKLRGEYDPCSWQRLLSK